MSTPETPAAYTCPFCRMSSEGASQTCQFCGAPILDPKSLEETQREVQDALLLHPARLVIGRPLV